MNDYRDVFAECPSTDINYARVRVVIELPDGKDSLSQDMLIPDYWLDDFKAEREAKEHLHQVMDLSNCEAEQRLAAHELTRRSEHCRMIRQNIANSISLALGAALERGQG